MENVRETNSFGFCDLPQNELTEINGGGIAGAIVGAIGGAVVGAVCGVVIVGIAVVKNQNVSLSTVGKTIATTTIAGAGCGCCLGSLAPEP